MEQKLYELLGIKKFRILIFKVVEFILYLPLKFKFGSVEAKQIIKDALVMQTGSNYRIGKGFNLNVLKKHKKILFIYAVPHAISLYATLDLILHSQTLFTLLFGIPWSLMNIYCIMLQRYNQIRINKVIKKFESKEKREIEETKKVILEESKSKDITLTLEKIFNDEAKQITIDKLITKMSLQDLKKYSDYLKYIKENQTYLDTLNDDNTQILPLSDNKHILRMKYNSKNI